jgi:uncharacterized oligopeptide transporter (OPT) family protein
MAEPAPAGPPSEPEAPTSELTRSHFPRLSIAEWAVFAALAAVLAVTNIYTTLLTGWGDGGSIIAVLAAVGVLGVLQRRKPRIESLNLGQTMASAGGSVGFAVSFYAAVKMLQPDFAPNPIVFGLLFVGMGILGALIGTSVRKYLVRYFFPSGTACAVIQRTVTSSGEEASRPVRLLGIWSAISGLLTLPTKITFTQGGAALLKHIPLGGTFAISLEPLLYGIGLVVGPRIGLGMLIGALIGPFVIVPQLEAAQVPASSFSDWIRWSAIAVLTVPTFATILFAYLFRSPVVVPEGFRPGAVAHGPPPARNFVYAGLAILGALITGLTGQQVFGVPLYATVATVAVSWPLCVMNGRVTGDTDINPVRLVAVVLLSLFATMISGGAVVLLGIAIVGGTLAAIGVDMMQDFRTGHLINANPAHQTTVQILGAVVGAIVSVPFILLIDARLGFGEGRALPAPGAQIWSAMASAFTGGADLPPALLTMVAVVSVVGSIYALFTVWPRTAPWMPSLFGLGLGLLLPFEMSAAIFIGGLGKLIATYAYRAGKSGDAAKAAEQDAGNDTMLVGSGTFAASAIISVLVVLLTSLLGALGLGWFYLAEG